MPSGEHFPPAEIEGDESYKRKRIMASDVD